MQKNILQEDWELKYPNKYNSFLDYYHNRVGIDNAIIKIQRIYYCQEFTSYLVFKINQHTVRFGLHYLVSLLRDQEYWGYDFDLNFWEIVCDRLYELTGDERLEKNH